MAATVWQLPLGTQAAWEVDLLDLDGNPIVAFAAGDAPSAVVWAGDDQAVIAGAAPACSWIGDPAAGGKVRVAFSAANAAAIGTPGTYAGRVVVTPSGGGDPILAAAFDLQLLDGPGSAVVPKTYIAYRDLRDCCDWIDRLKSATDLAGFLAQRAQATDWADDVIQRHYRGDRGIYGGRSPDYSLDHLYFGTYRSGRASTVLQGWLDASPTRLVLNTPSGKAFKRALARKAIAFICERSLSESSEGNPYRALAAEFHAEADDLIAQCTLEVDTDGDGTPDLAIELGWCDVLQG